MSKKTQHPLPTIGSQNWGSTLNNYLRGQAYSNQEIQQEIEEIYAQQTNVAQTVLSSGILSESVDSKRPGLYTGTGQVVDDGAELTFSSTSKYYYKGYGVIFGNAIISELIGGESGLELTLPANFTKTVDARCVYAYYDIANSVWQLKFGADTESSINLDPYYICLGVLIKINTKYYWHYKTMKSNLSTSSKKWMMDEPHATLNTYMTYDSTNSKIGVFFDEALSGELTVQALGINPFPSTEPGTNDLLSDIKTFTLANAGTTASYSFVILEPTYDSENKVTGWTLKLDYTITNDKTSVYRLCATSVTIDGKALLLWQKAIHSLDIERSIFNDSDFNRLWYFCDPVELYRVKGSTMKATVGSGLSPINANGIDPHVTTLIKDSDGVWFGKDNNNKFRFDSTGIDDEFKVVMTVPENQGATSMLLTNNMIDIPQPIKIQNSLSPLVAGGNNVNNYIKMYRGDSDASYHNITLATKQGGEGAYAHFTGQGYIKLGAYEGNNSFNVDSDTPNASIYIKSKNRGTADNYSNIRIDAEYIDIYSDSITNVSDNVQMNNGTTTYCAIQHRDDRSQIHLGTDASKNITIYAGNADEDPCILVGGGGTTLSSGGLYFPSDSNITGITIDNIQGKIEDSSAHKFYNVGLGDLAKWTNGEATEDTVDEWTISSYNTVTQCKAPMAEVFGQSTISPWNFHTDGYAHWYWFRNPSEDESTISVDQPPAINEGDSITITYTKNSTGEEVTETYDNWAIVGDRHGRYGYIKDAKNNVIWTIILSTTPSIITSYLAPKLNNPLHIKNYFLCGMISSSKLDLKAYGADVKVKINDQATALTKIKAVSEASLTLGTLADRAYMNVDYIGDGNLGIRSTAASSWISISDGFNGCLYMYGCNSGGRAVMLNNNGTVKINKNTGNINISNSTGEINLSNSNISFKKYNLHCNSDEILTLKSTSDTYTVSDTVRNYYKDSIFAKGGPLIFLSDIGSESKDFSTNENNTSWPCINNYNYVRDLGYSYLIPDDTSEGIYTKTLLVRGCNAYVHEWVKISISARNVSGWCMQTFWALTGAINKYYWEVEGGDKFYMQYGKNDGDSTNCADYFTISTTRSEWYTSSISNPKLQYKVRVEYAGAPGCGLDLAGTAIPETMKVCFMTGHKLEIWHKLQGGSTSNHTGTAVYMGLSKEECNAQTYRAPYNYCVGRDWEL